MMAAMGPLRDALGDDFASLGLFGGGGGGGRGGRGGGGANVLVSSGDYRITIVAGSNTMSKLLRVEDLGVGGEKSAGVPNEAFDNNPLRLRK